MVCRCVIRLELDRSFIFAIGSGQIDFAKEQYFAEREMRFSQVGIKAESFEGGLFRFRTRLAPVCASVKRGQNVGAGKAGISQRVIWIAPDRQLIERDCFWNVVARTLFPKRSAFVVKLVRGRVSR